MNVWTKNEYALLDSGAGLKLEQFGNFVLERPCAQAVWTPSFPERWRTSNARFTRKEGLRWSGREQLPDSWEVVVEGVRMKLSTTDFGHLGIFPETRSLWMDLRQRLSDAVRAGRSVSFLNLFAYSGGATLAAAQAGASCCHVDAAKGMVQWARENADLNCLGDAPIRWIVDDVNKFLEREHRRGRTYDAVLLDPPSFGRGKQGELYKIEEDLITTLRNVAAVLSEQPLFVYLTSHTPGFSPVVLRNLLQQLMPKTQLLCGEMLLEGEARVLPLPSGSWAMADFS